MATVLELERLRALTAQLVPLTTIQRGDVIRADNWNLVVGALVELARAVGTLQTEGDVPLHDHIGEVAIDWLDPKLRQLVERGPLDDPIAVMRVQQVEQRALQLSRSIEGVGSDLQSVRARLDEAVTRDLVRENSVVRVSQKVEGIADARNDVAALRRTMSTISNSVEGAVALRRDLEIDGKLIDVRALNERLGTLEQMRDKLRMPSGQLLDAVTIEQRLSATENKYVSRADLDEILRTRGGGLSAGDIDGIKGDLRAQFAVDIESVQKKFADQLSGELNNRFADIEGLVAKSVSNTIPDLRDTLSESLRTELLMALKDTSDKLRADYESKLGGLRDEMSATIDKGITALGDNVKKDLDDIRKQIVPREEFGSMLNDRVGPIEESVAKVSADRAATDKRLSGDVADLGTRVASLDASVTGSIKELDTRLTTQIESTRLDLTRTIDSRLSQEITASESRTSVLIAGSQKSTDKQFADMNAQITAQRAADQKSNLAASDKSTATQIAASETRSSDATKKLVDTQIAASETRSSDATKKLVDTQIAASETRSSDATKKLVDTQIAASETRSSDATKKLVDTQVAAGLKSFEATLDTRITTSLKKEFDASVPGLVDSSVKLALGQTSGGRTIAQPAGDDFTKIPGVGASLTTRLTGKGITTYKQLAAMKPADVATLLGKSETDAAAIIKEAKRLGG